MKANVTDVRGIARSGVCMPINCTQSDINFGSAKVVGMVNNAIGLLPSLGINIDTIIFKTNFSQVNMNFLVTDYQDELSRSESKTGFVVTATILGTILFLTIAANIEIYIFRAFKRFNNTQNKIGDSIDNIPEIKR